MSGIGQDSTLQSDGSGSKEVLVISASGALRFAGSIALLNALIRSVVLAVASSMATESKKMGDKKH